MAVRWQLTSSAFLTTPFLLPPTHICPLQDPAAFSAELDSFFRNMDREHLRRESQSVIRDVIERMRQHNITLRSSVSTVVVTSMVLEGWSSQLDPDVRILDTMRDMLATDWGERVGRAVDRIMASGQLLDDV